MPGTPGRSGGNRHMGIDATQTDGLPELPRGRSKAFQRHWRFLLETLPTHSLRRVDAVQLTLLASLLEEIEQLDKIIAADPADLKARSLRLRVSQQVSRLSAQFGLSPADRQRLALDREQADDDDPVSELLSRLSPRPQ